MQIRGRTAGVFCQYENYYTKHENNFKKRNFYFVNVKSQADQQNI